MPGRLNTSTPIIRIIQTLIDSPAPGVTIEELSTLTEVGLRTVWNAMQGLEDVRCVRRNGTATTNKSGMTRGTMPTLFIWTGARS